MAVAELLMNPLAGWHPNEATAMTLYAQDARLLRIKESRELIDVYRGVNPAKYRSSANCCSTPTNTSPTGGPASSGGGECASAELRRRATQAGRSDWSPGESVKYASSRHRPF